MPVTASEVWSWSGDEDNWVDILEQLELTGAPDPSEPAEVSLPLVGR